MLLHTLHVLYYLENQLLKPIPTQFYLYPSYLEKIRRNHQTPPG